MKPTNAPACFAAASVFTHDSEVCRQCCAFDACAAASLETLEQIRHVVNVADLLKRHEKAKKVSREAIKAADEKKLADQPPGNNQPPLTGAVERKTEVVAVKFEVTPEEEAVVAKLSSKVQPIVVRMLKRGALSQVKKSVKEKHNALAESEPEWLRLAVDHMIAGGFTRSELRETLKTKLDWADSSTGPHASMAALLLKGFGIAQEIEGRLVPAPAYA
jgi:hypothetical protein